MRKTNTAPQGTKQIPLWQMPICPKSYPDRHSALTEEEEVLIQRYLTASGSSLAYWTKSWLKQLARFERPFLDTVRLTTDTDRSLVAGRRHLFTYMLQTGKAFWAWPQEIWIEVIQSAPQGRTGSGTRFWMITLAYLFCNFLYVGPVIPYGNLADAIFGTDLVEAEVSRLHSPLVGAGYSTDPEERQRFRWLCALVMLTNRSPYAEAFSASVLIMVNESLSSIPSVARVRGRRDLMRLQTALCHLDILDEPALLLTTEASGCPPALNAHDGAADPLWLLWVRAFYEQTPYRNEKTMRETCYHLITAGRWLKKLRRQTFLDEFFFKGRKVAFRRLTEAMLLAPSLMTTVKFTSQGTPSCWINKEKLCLIQGMET
jgi:hypothetical protein